MKKGGKGKKPKKQTKKPPREEDLFGGDDEDQDDGLGMGIGAAMLRRWAKAIMPNAQDLAVVKANAQRANLHLAKVLSEFTGLPNPAVNGAARLAMLRAGVMPETEAKVAMVKGKTDDKEMKITVHFDRKPIPEDDDA